MMESTKETRLICIHAPPVTEEWVHYTEYMARLLGAELVYRNQSFPVDDPTTLAREQDVILLYEPVTSWWQRVLGRTASARLVTRGPASVLVTRQLRWPLAHLLLIFRAEPSDEAAIAWTLALAQAGGAAVTVLPLLPSIPALYAPNSGAQLHANQLLATNTPPAVRLRRLLEQFDRWQIPVVICPGRGEPLWQMREALTGADYDLVLVGAEPPSQLHRFLVGDLVRSLLHCANCPVFAARNAPRRGEERDKFPEFQTNRHPWPVGL